MVVLFGLATLASGLIPLFLLAWVGTVALAGYVHAHRHILRSASAASPAIERHSSPRREEDTVGLFSRTKEIGTVTIQFADENTASVVTTTDGRWTTNIKLFCWYYARVLTNLGNSDDIAKQLMELTDDTVRQALNTGQVQDSVLPNGFTLIPSLTRAPAKICQGTLMEGQNSLTAMNTQFSRGGEGYFAPVSVIAVLQHVLNKLDEQQQPMLWLAIAGMHNYYGERGWTHIQSINEAPSVGLAFATEAVARQSRPAAT